jgi:phage baseplate assembly protein W
MATVLEGFAFPFQITPVDPTTGEGGVASLSGDEKLRANIVHILLTNVGERVMRRAYGGGLRALVQEPNNGALVAVVQHQVGKSIGALEPRVLLQQLTVSQSDDGATLFVSVTYLVKRTQAVQTLRVPIALSSL